MKAVRRSPGPNRMGSSLICSETRKKTNAKSERWSCISFQTAGKSLSVLTTVDPKKLGSYSPSKHLKCKRFGGKSQYAIRAWVWNKVSEISCLATICDGSPVISRRFMVISRLFNNFWDGFRSCREKIFHTLRAFASFGILSSSPFSHLSDAV